MILSHESAVRNVSELTEMIASGAGIAIAAAIAEGKRLPVTKLRDDLSKKLSIDGALCYHIISNYIQTRGDLRVYMGPRGGIGLA